MRKNQYTKSINNRRNGKLYRLRKQRKWRTFEQVLRQKIVTKQPVSVSDQRTAISKSNKCDAIEIDSENMSKSWQQPLMKLPQQQLLIIHQQSLYPQKIESIVAINQQNLKGQILEAAVRKFAKFTGEHLCQSLFFNKVTG